MKKILAVLLALAMLLGFAACGGNNEDTTTTTEEDIFAEFEEDTTAAEDVTEDAAAEETTAAEEETTVTEEETTVAEETTADAEETTKAGETTAATTKAVTTAATTKAASKGLNSEDAAEIVEYYKAAAKKTGRITDTKKMWLAEDITGEGAVGTVLKTLQPLLKSVIEGLGSTKERDFPGSDDAVARITAADVAKAKAVSKDGKTTIAIQLKEQVDGPDGNGKTDGPVARGIGTLDGIEEALAEVDGEITRGRDTVTLTYKNPTIKVVVDENTGKIIEGTWKYEINIDVADADLKILGFKLTAKNLHTVIGFSLEM